VVETFHQPRLIPKYLTESNVPSWESSAKSGVKLAVFVQISPKSGGLLPKFMQQSISFNKGGFSLPTVLTYELDAGSSLPIR
jgi:hypothetical protein